MNLTSMTSWTVPLALAALAGSFALPACGSKSSGFPGDDMSGSEDASTGSSSGTQSSGSGSSSGSQGSGTGSGSSSTGSNNSGSSSGSSSTGAKDAGGSGSKLDASADGPTIIDCGGSCNLSTQTCCLPSTMQGKCIARTSKCPQFNAAFSCGGAVDCPANQVCCGEVNATLGEAKTVCAASCPTQSMNDVSGKPNIGQAQVCRASAECQNHMECIPQTCLNMANLNLCGLTSQDPFMCVAQ